MVQSESIKTQALTGMIWSSVGSIVFQVIRIVTQIFLARLLWPEAFGLFALVMAFISIAQYLIENGLTVYLIRKNDLTHSESSTLFFANVLFSLLIYSFYFIISPFLASYFNESVLSDMLRVLSLVLILNALSSVHKALLIRNIQFRGQAIINLIASLISGLLAIYLAYVGWGIWSLVAYNILYQVFETIMLFKISDFKPNVTFDKAFFKKASVYSWKLMLSGLLNTLYENIFHVALAGFYSVSSLGYFTNAQKIRDGAAKTLTDSIQKVSFPVLSKMQDDPDRLKNNTRRILKSSVFVIFPLLVGLSATSKYIILTIFNDQWLEMIPYIQILAINGLLIPLHKINLNILNVVGRTDIYLKLEIIKKLIALVTLSIAFYFRIDILSLLWVLLFNSTIGYVLNSWYSGKLISYPIGEQLMDSVKIVLGSLSMGLLVYLVPRIITLSYIMTLGLQVLVGILSYTMFSYYFLPNEFNMVLDLIKSIKLKLAR